MLHYPLADGEQIPYTLHLLLENMKKQYLTMVHTMQTKVGGGQSAFQ